MRDRIGRTYQWVHVMTDAGMSAGSSFSLLTKHLTPSPSAPIPRPKSVCPSLPRDLVLQVGFKASSRQRALQDQNGRGKRDDQAARLGLHRIKRMTRSSSCPSLCLGRVTDVLVGDSTGLDGNCGRKVQDGGSASIRRRTMSSNLSPARVWRECPGSSRVT